MFSVLPIAICGGFSSRPRPYIFFLSKSYAWFKLVEENYVYSSDKDIPILQDKYISISSSASAIVILYIKRECPIEQIVPMN